MVDTTLLDEAASPHPMGIQLVVGLCFTGTPYPRQRVGSPYLRWKYPARKSPTITGGVRMALTSDPQA